MKEIHRHAPIQGEISVQPDREMAHYALLLGSLARGRTTLNELTLSPVLKNFCSWLQSNHYDIQIQDHQVIIEGKGLQASLEPYQKLPQDSFSRFLALCLLSGDTETWFTLETPVDDEDLQGFQVKQEEGRLLFLAPDLSAQPHAAGYVPHRTRIRILLQALLHHQPLEIIETSSTRDQLVGMLRYFGAPIQVENTGAEQLSELERRLARLQGQKQERQIQTVLKPTHALTGKELYVPGDVTVASAYALLATLLHGSQITLRNVNANAGRAGFFSALKRMGAHIEATQKRERYGDCYASFSVQSIKRLTGRRLAGETINHSLEELPLLAVAACFAEGETILRLPEHITSAIRPNLERLTHNLRKTGVDIGLYEEGLVIRGHEDVDAADFETHADAVSILAYQCLGFCAHGVTHLPEEDDQLLQEILPSWQPSVPSALPEKES